MTSKKTNLLMAFLLAGIMIMQMASAGVGYRSETFLYDATNITRTYAYFQHGQSLIAFQTSLCFFNYCYTSFIVDETEFVPRGQPLQLYIQYGLDPIASWNLENPNSTIDYCRMLIKETHNTIAKDGSVIQTITYTLNRTFTTSDITVSKDQFRHFIALRRGSYAEVYSDCHFIGNNQTILSPLSFIFVTPTANCKACQYYENFKNSFDNVIGDAIQIYKNRILENIKLFVRWNMEIWTNIFSILRIILLVAVLGSAFLLFYYIYLLIRSFVRRHR
jgi:hypothetical protein